MSGGTEATLMLEAVAAFLREEVQGELSGFKGYGNRVATNMLGIVAREMESGEALWQLDRDFAEARGLDTGRPLPALARALRDGSVAADERTIAYLRERTLAQLAIDNPRYSGFRRARAAWGEGKT